MFHHEHKGRITKHIQMGGCALSSVDTGFRLCLRAANANNGDNGGWCCLNGNNGLSDANANWGSSQSYDLRERKTLPHGKRYTGRGALVGCYADDGKRVILRDSLNGMQL